MYIVWQHFELYDSSCVRKKLINLKNEDVEVE